MGLGVLEDRKLEHVPGTILLDELSAQAESETANLKHGTGKDAHIILAPQPSEDPNDPLNWSWFRKHFVFGILLLGSILNAATQVYAPLLETPLMNIGAITSCWFYDNCSRLQQDSHRCCLNIWVLSPRLRRHRPIHFCALRQIWQAPRFPFLLDNGRDWRNRRMCSNGLSLPVGCSSHHWILHVCLRICNSCSGRRPLLRPRTWPSNFPRQLRPRCNC
jgi:hypothetical protein